MERLQLEGRAEGGDEPQNEPELGPQTAPQPDRARPGVDSEGEAPPERPQRHAERRQRGQQYPRCLPTLSLKSPDEKFFC